MAEIKAFPYQKKKNQLYFLYFTLELSTSFLLNKALWKFKWLIHLKTSASKFVAGVLVYQIIFNVNGKSLKLPKFWFCKLIFKAGVVLRVILSQSLLSSFLFAPWFKLESSHKHLQHYLIILQIPP